MDPREQNLDALKKALQGLDEGPELERFLELLAADPRKGARRLIERTRKSKVEARRRDARWRAFCDPEHRLRARGYTRIAGVDEAGRGPLAGPVVAGAVILPDGFTHHRLDDSKRMTPAAREEAFDVIAAGALAWSTGSASAAEVDRHNILGAVHLAIDRALKGLDPPPEFALVDGRPLTACAVPHQALVKGDRRSRVIAAASVIAKVTRDRRMRELEAAHPGYGFSEHKGYGTAAHLDALRRLGPSPAHRRSFLHPESQGVLPVGGRLDTTAWGRRAEALVAAACEEAGLAVRHRNWRGGGGELDLVCWGESSWVFVEVKAARSGGAGPPAGWLQAPQRRRWRQAATAFLEGTDNDHPGAGVRFDLATVVVGPDGVPRVERIEGVEP